MSYYQVSDENMSKVESYFVNKVKAIGSKRFEATVVDIAEASGVALATAHKAIKQLEEEKRIQIIKPSSRRFPISYVYNGDIEGFQETQNQQSQIQYLQDLINSQQAQLQMLTKENKEQAGTIRILKSQKEQHNFA